MNKSRIDKIIPVFRICLVIVILGAMILYVFALLRGDLTADRKIDVTTLAVIAFAIVLCTVIITPDLFQRLKVFQVSSFKLELLEKVREKQAEQEIKLDDIALILPLLLSEDDQELLLKIANGNDLNYKGSHSIRTELRKLRSAGLVKSKPGTHIADLKDETLVDVSKLLELTLLGSRWVSWINEIEQREKNNS